MLEAPAEIHPAQLWYDFPNVTQAKIAEQLGVHIKTVEKWINGRLNPSTRSRVSAARLYAEWEKQRDGENNG